MKVLVQNLQKRSALATELINEHDPDVMLAQEINLSSESHAFQASNVSSLGYGTAISSKDSVTDIKRVNAPSAEFGGFVHKKTTVATTKFVQVVSFHGYNGQPFKSIEKLVEHVRAVLSLLTPGPAVFAGDFNTWSQGHLDGVKALMEKYGFHLAYSWPYPGRDYPLDHAFLRGMQLENSSHFKCASDHLGAILELVLVKEDT
jgi:endonuclease/exonuclease/phosphatase (EEP) superfamily protein YafD